MFSSFVISSVSVRFAATLLLLWRRREAGLESVESGVGGGERGALFAREKDRAAEGLQEGECGVLLVRGVRGMREDTEDEAVLCFE